MELIKYGDSLRQGTDKLNVAITHASEAKEISEQAIQIANTATENADEAALTANQAAENANTAAELANGEAADLNELKTDVIEATSNANNAADNAQQIANEIHTIWQAPVVNFADIASTYPNPTHGWTVMVSSTGEVYRYNFDEWILTQVYTDTSITDVQNKIGVIGDEVITEFPQNFGGFGNTPTTPIYYVFKATRPFVLRSVDFATNTSNPVVMNYKLYKLLNGDSVLAKEEKMSKTVTVSKEGINTIELDFDIPNDGYHYALVELNRVSGLPFSSHTPLASISDVISDVNAKFETGYEVSNYFHLNWKIAPSIESRMKIIKQDVSESKKSINDLSSQLAEMETEVTTLDVNKANKTEVDTQLNNKRDKSVLISLNDADSEFVSAITGGATVNITSIPKDYSVHPEKTTFIEKSSNLLNEIEYTNGIVIGADGIETANVSFQTTPLKPIPNNKQITLFGVNYFSEYTDGGQFIKRTTLPVTTNEPSTITTNANTAFYRASFKNVLESSYNGKRQINYGATLLSYEPFYERLKIDIKSINPSSIGDKTIDKIKLKDDVLPPNSNFGATLVGDAENFNFDFTNSQLVVKGSLVRLLHRDTSYLLNAQTLTLPSATTWQKIVYNLDTMLLEQVANNAILTKNQVYVCSYRKSTRQVVGIQSYYVNGSPVTNTGGGSNVPSLDLDVNTFDLKTIVNETTTKAFYDAKTYPDKADLYSMYKDNFYALFDSLMAQYPNNITRTQWGLDYNGEPIYYYEFKPYDTRNSVSEPFSKMILISGMHGWEKTGIYTLYLTLKDIYDNNETDEHLNMLYSNVHFIVAPCCNHYGMANNIRKNENGIDPSRNFSAGFVAGTDPASSVYSGTTAFSEISSQFVKSLVDTHTDAVYFGSFHNFKLEDGATYNSFIWNASATPMQVTLGKHHVKEMTHKWRKEFIWFPTNLDYFTGYADLSAPGGSEAMYAVSKGIQASTYEVCEGHNAETGVTRFNATTWHLSTECFTNWLVLNLRKNVEFYNHKAMLIG